MSMKKVSCKFSAEFLESLKTDPFSMMVYTALESGGDPYKLLETLLSQNREMRDELMKYKIEEVRRNASVQLADGTFIPVHTAEDNS